MTLIEELNEKIQDEIDNSPIINNIIERIDDLAAENELRKQENAKLKKRIEQLEGLAEVPVYVTGSLHEHQDVDCPCQKSHSKPTL